MSSTSELDICNAALSKLGGEPVSALTANNKRARLCNQQYNKMRDKLLRMHPWNFALKRIALTPLVGEPPFEFRHMFQIPTDNLRIYRVEDSRLRYKVEGDLILADATTVNLVYVSREENVALYDSAFAELLALLLAADISYALIQSGTLTKNLWEQFHSDIKEIRSYDGQEGFPDGLNPDTFTLSRVTSTIDPTKLG